MGKQAIRVLAADFGAGSGRVVQGSYDGARLELQEVHRFANDPVQLGTDLYWDFLRLYHELKEGIAKGARSVSGIHSIAVDTWGVDFGLVDGTGRLLRNPRHYRDASNKAWMHEAVRLVSERELYRMSGVLPQQINSVFQLFGRAREHAEHLGSDTRMMFIPDLFHYYLSGVQSCEYTIASTSGLLQAGRLQWNEPLLHRLGLPETLFPEVVPSGTILGGLSGDLREELQTGPMQVVAAGSHDTASAVAAIPATGSDHAFISCGTWSLMGMEMDKPVFNHTAHNLGFTNEGTVDGRIRLLKNRSGLWLLQECKRQWEREGRSFSHEELVQLAATSTPHLCYVSLADEAFMAPGNMPERIRKQCEASRQAVPATVGAVVRCIIESLALEFRQTLEELERVTGVVPRVIHMVGGGVHNRLLCQLTANAAGIPVIAGPAEATSAGNCMVQLMAQGEFAHLGEIREVMKVSFSPQTYEPQEMAQWDEAYGAYQRLNMQT